MLQLLNAANAKSAAEAKSKELQQAMETARAEAVRHSERANAARDELHSARQEAEEARMASTPYAAHAHMSHCPTVNAYHAQTHMPLFSRARRRQQRHWLWSGRSCRLIRTRWLYNARQLPRRKSSSRSSEGCRLGHIIGLRCTTP